MRTAKPKATSMRGKEIFGIAGRTLEIVPVFVLGLVVSGMLGGMTAGLPAGAGGQIIPVSAGESL